MTHLPVHPLADLFPMMSDPEIDALAADIKRNGLLDPLVVHQDTLVDGRNRLAACRKAGIQPRFVEWSTLVPAGSCSLQQWIVSKNMNRRHLTAAQKALLVLDLVARFQKEGVPWQGPVPDGKLPSDVKVGAGGEVHLTKTQAASLCAAALGVSLKYVHVARKVVATASPDTLHALRTGHITLNAALTAQRRAERGKDALGREVPVSLAPTWTFSFEAADTLRRALANLNDCVQRVKNGAVDVQTRTGMPAIKPGHVVALDGFMQQINRMSDWLHRNTPHLIHDACGGLGCMRCGRRGWLSIYDAAVQEQDKLARASSEE